MFWSRPVVLETLLQIHCPKHPTNSTMHGGQRKTVPKTTNPMQKSSKGDWSWVLLGWDNIKIGRINFSFHFLDLSPQRLTTKQIAHVLTPQSTRNAPLDQKLHVAKGRLDLHEEVWALLILVLGWFSIAWPRIDWFEAQLVDTWDYEANTNWSDKRVHIVDTHLLATFLS